MKFKTGEVIYWEQNPQERWKILELISNIDGIARLLCVHGYATGRKATTYELYTAKKVTPRGHPLTKIFK